MKEFNLSTHIYFGEDSLSRLEQIQNKHVLIVCDSFMEQSGVADRLKKHLSSCEVYVFSKVVPDPPVAVVAEGIRCLTECRAEVMIAVGGGSAIDAAKAIRELAHQMQCGSIEECYAIPTTSGTGSEVTRFSVITDAVENVKYPLVRQSLQPMVAILDPELVKTVPPAITADTGLDALTHALEAYVSTDATDFTDALAEKAATLLVRFLPLAYANGNDLQAREKVHNASCLAGMAFNAAGLGICHSIAHAIGGKFHISHGRSNALVLPHVLAFNAQLETGKITVCAAKYQRMAKLLGLPYSNVHVAVSSLIRKVQEMERTFGMPSTLRDMQVDTALAAELKDEMIRTALADVCTATNPRKTEAADIERILAKVVPFSRG